MKPKQLTYLILLFWLAGCAGADQEAYSESMEAPADLKQEAMTTEVVQKPSTEAVIAERAIQKLEDLCESIGLISNPDYPAEFRTHAAKLTTNLFLTDTVKAVPFCGSNPLPLPVSAWMAELPGVSSSLSVVPERIRFEPTASASAKNGRFGTLLFYPLIRCDSSAAPLPARVWEVEVYEIEVLKSFGDETEPVWEVYLGNLRPSMETPIP